MQSSTFYFYDLETSGFSPREQRIMQFGGQRTDANLREIGEPHNFLIKLTEDVLPDPTAVLLTGITPQMTVADGLTEAEFLTIFHREIATPGTIFVGFNNIRFDDEFIRFLNYRNFYDAYEWHWLDGRSRWDLLDVVRMTRALRPDGIKWPFDSAQGKPSNRLEDLASINNLNHNKAHDALSDVNATIELARLLRQKQPKLFDHLLRYRDKKLVSKLITTPGPFTYTSGKYSSTFLHTTVAMVLGTHPKKQAVIVYDLRFSPDELLKLSDAEFLERWQHRCSERPCSHSRIPLKIMQFNRCPAVAPINVIDQASQKRLAIDLDQINDHQIALLKIKDKLYTKFIKVLDSVDQAQAGKFNEEQVPEAALYDSFIPDADKRLSKKLVVADPENLVNYMGKFQDARLNSLLPLYISKNYSKQQSDDIYSHFEEYKKHKLLESGDNNRLMRYFMELEEQARLPDTTKQRQYLLEELQLWGQIIMSAN